MSALKRLALGLVVLLVGTLSACSTIGAQTPAPTGPTAECTYPASGGAARPVDVPPTQASRTGTLTATMQMAAGEVTFSFPRANAPCAINSFESLVLQGYYDQTRCHRLVDQGIFILQCGDPSATGRGGPGYTYADELGGDETYPRGTVAMANAGPDTNGSQFFICWSDTPLSSDYVVLGTIDEESLLTIGKIASQGVDAKDGMTPIADASITRIVLG